jgi:hypothetical protein
LDAGIANITLSGLSPKKAGRNGELYFNHQGANLAIDMIIREDHQTIAVLSDVAKAISCSQKCRFVFQNENLAAPTSWSATPEKSLYHKSGSTKKTFVA